ncbi:hypothetical protein KZ440_01875 [Glaesserella parasuis]|nr:hypothetical protein [Glaesserella parasuis]MCT8788007.1 hypothetical protein [Glaesserella parasuis]
MTIVERSSILSFALKSMSYKEIEQVGGVFERKAQPLRTAPHSIFTHDNFLENIGIPEIIGI